MDCPRLAAHLPGCARRSRATASRRPRTCETDLWGRVSDRVRAGAALDEAARADLAAARLSLQAGLADAFLTLRVG